MDLEDDQPEPFTRLASLMHEDIKTRFSFVTNPEHPQFEPLYITATYLFPGTRFLLEDDQINLAQAYIPKLYSNWYPAAVLDVVDTSDAQSVDTDSTQPSTSRGLASPTKRRSSNYLQKLTNKSNAKRQKVQSPVQVELDTYEALAEQEDLDITSDPREYWLVQRNRLPKLFRLAMDIFVMQASSAAVERVFSTVNYLSTGRRSRLAATHLEEEVFIQRNFNHLPDAA